MPDIDTDDNAEADRRQAMLRAHVAQLAEHFDSVQIFCTRFCGDEGTASHDFGGGNWYARFGQVKEWMIHQDETCRVNQRRKNDE